MSRTKYKLVGRSEHGLYVKARVNVPRKCKTPKRICIKCQHTVIHKLSKYYDTKVCEQCSNANALSQAVIDSA